MIQRERITLDNLPTSTGPVKGWYWVDGEGLHHVAVWGIEKVAVTKEEAIQKVRDTIEGP